jgi:hypothetical protein
MATPKKTAPAAGAANDDAAVSKAEAAKPETAKADAKAEGTKAEAPAARKPAARPRSAKSGGAKASRGGAKTARPAARRTAPRRAGGDAKAGEGLSLLSIGAIVGAVAAGVFALVRLGRAAAHAPGPNEHVPTDLTGDSHPDGSERAPVDFRPDPTAPVPPEARDAFRPALAGASAPTLVSGQAPELARLDAAPN